MNLSGIWKPFGRFVHKDQEIIIQDQEITFWIGSAGSNPRQTTVPFHLEEDQSLRKNHCCNIKIDDEEFRNTDYFVHEEIIEEKPVVILSQMTMEYDGRGRIVIFSYVREEDYSLVNDEFKSLAYKYWNDRPSVPMMQMNPGVGFPMGMMGCMGNMTDLMSGMMNLNSAAVTTPSTTVEPWDCICGNKQITTRFCGECGMPMPK